MNRNELVDAVAGKTELRKAEASKAVDAVFDAIEEALKNGDDHFSALMIAVVQSDPFQKRRGGAVKK